METSACAIDVHSTRAEVKERKILKPVELDVLQISNTSSGTNKRTSKQKPK